ncbi:MAG: HdeD family acid-resistance protein [Proteobacteria bacterium]|nr:HdeD family acid-resistance protein [Pseudomonadota bacterium]
MNTTGNAATGMFSEYASAVRSQWGWMLVLGICLLILGILGVIYSLAFTITSVLVFGWILVIAGIIGGIQAIRHRKTTDHVFLYVLNAVLSIVLGVMLLRSPVAGAVILTLLLAMYFIVAAVFRIVMAFRMRGVPGWGWMLFDGIVTLILGILIWAQWPVSGLWVIGLFIGIDLIVVGWSQIMMAFAVRTIPKAA